MTGKKMANKNEKSAFYLLDIFVGISNAKKGSHIAVFGREKVLVYRKC